MNSFHRRAWILSLGLAALTSCKGEVNDEPAVDPLDDPWVDAIEAEEAAVAVPEAAPEAAPEALGGVDEVLGTGSEGAPLAVTDASAPAEARPAAPEPTASSKHDAEPTPETPADSGEGATAADNEVAEPASEPVTEPTPAPTPEAAKPESPPPITSADFHGHYRFVGGSAQRDDVTAAIEDTVNQLPGAIRGIARRRLTSANPVDDTMDIVIAGDKITTTYGSAYDLTCVLDGASVSAKGREGEKLRVRVRSKDSKLVQVMEGKGGARTVVFVLSADRKRLTVHHRITADRLPQPMTYRLSYTRK